MKVLIVSIYSQNIINAQNFNSKWIILQNKFINEFTKDYEFGVYLSNVKEKSIFKDCKIIGENHSNLDGPRSHRLSLRETIKYFINHKTEYDYFCILDSDCFPIRDNWETDLATVLEKRNLMFSAIVRYENSEAFPHPSAMFVASKYLIEDVLRFPDEFTNASKNILEGGFYKDAGSENSFWNKDGNLIGYQLIRTNIINLHPINAGIYGDIFYHHGFGSRFISNESTETTINASRYWKRHHTYFCRDNKLLFELFFNNPKLFIDYLRGKNLFESNKFVKHVNLSPKFI